MATEENDRWDVGVSQHQVEIEELKRREGALATLDAGAQISSA